MKRQNLAVAGISVDFLYDVMNRVVKKQSRKGSVDIVGFEYAYNQFGNRQQDIHLHHSRNSEFYQYDSNMRLVGYKRGLTEDSAGFTQNWQLDKLGNWTLFHDNGKSETRQHNAVNELLSVQNRPDYAYIYDDNGNLTQEIRDPQGGNSSIRYGWDALNRLVSIDSTTGAGDREMAEYTYDAFNRRVMKRIDADQDGVLDTKVQYVVSGQQVIEEYRNDVLNKDYVYGGQYIDEVLMTGSGGDTIDSFYLSDLRYSVYALVDRNGDVQERYMYDPYGKRTVLDAGFAERGESAFGNEIGYTGRLHDAESGLMYYRARYYTPSLGRFLSRDPIGVAGGINLYAYVQNNPVNFVDPMGLLSPPTHFLITYNAARDSGRGVVDSVKLAWGATAVDFKADSQERNYEATRQHAMGGILPDGTQQTRAEAIAATVVYINTCLENGNLSGAIHAAQDLVTPAHAGQAWEGFGLNEESVIHIAGDVFPSSATQEEALDITLKILNNELELPESTMELLGK